eukprot:1564138-Pyramimonas_sp.AAC.1
MTWQEVRLPSARPRWLVRLAAEHGWGIACSPPPPADRHGHGGVVQGGAAILWRRSLGRIS